MNSQSQIGMNSKSMAGLPRAMAGLLRKWMICLGGYESAIGNTTTWWLSSSSKSGNDKTNCEGRIVADDVHFEWHMDEFEHELGKRVAAVRLITPRALREGVAWFEMEIQGELLEHEHPPGTKTPSPPGGFPGEITGRLARSLTTKGIALNQSFIRMVKSGLGNDSGSWSITFGPTAVYARIQELGGWTGKGHKTFLPARPYFKPAMTGEWGPKNFIRSMMRDWSRAWNR